MLKTSVLRYVSLSVYVCESICASVFVSVHAFVCVCVCVCVCVTALVCVFVCVRAVCCNLHLRIPPVKPPSETAHLWVRRKRVMFEEPREVSWPRG